MTEPVRGNINTVSYIGTVSGQFYDPVSEKFKELEERIDAWQNKFEFVDIKKELNYVGRERTWKI